MSKNELKKTLNQKLNNPELIEDECDSDNYRKCEAYYLKNYLIGNYKYMVSFFLINDRLNSVSLMFQDGEFDREIMDSVELDLDRALQEIDDKKELGRVVTSEIEGLLTDKYGEPLESELTEESQEYKWEKNRTKVTLNSSGSLVRVLYEPDETVLKVTSQSDNSNQL
ncbi:hypothetical protein [Myxosarcina sp. GI1]|uniref:hypothetical protein n=1 Tax=Myxosarcina sp. GI1 TaxID=1541065 RepID=UPI0005688196|nr:hypothetical protein [Myxosarcina sp. GI1]